MVPPAHNRMPLAPVTRARLQAIAAVAGTGFLFWRFNHAVPLAFFILAILFAALAWLSPRHYAPIQRTLDSLLNAFLIALTWTILGLVYFGLFTPLRLFRTLTRRDSLALRRPPTNDSYLRLLPTISPRFDRQF